MAARCSDRRGITMNGICLSVCLSALLIFAQPAHAQRGSSSALHWTRQLQSAPNSTATDTCPNSQWRVRLLNLTLACWPRHSADLRMGPEMDCIGLFHKCYFKLFVSDCIPSKAQYLQRLQGSAYIHGTAVCDLDPCTCIGRLERAVTYRIAIYYCKGRQR